MLILSSSAGFGQAEDIKSSFVKDEVVQVDDSAEDLSEKTGGPAIEAGNPAPPSSLLGMNVSFSCVNESLKNALNALTENYGLTFIYDDILADVKGITFKADDEPLRDVLDRLLEGSSLSYLEYGGGQIVLAKVKSIADKTGTIRGSIKDDKGDALAAANVIVRELSLGAATDVKGNYVIKSLKPGIYTVEVTFLGFESRSRRVKVVEGEAVEINFILKSSSFQIGGIEVIGTTDLLPKDVNTKTTITSGEIEHYQASSIKDVLDLVPGVQKSANQGLGKTATIAIRGDESDQLSTFGTLIMLDGTPVSNNANLQFERNSVGGDGGNIRGGVDLRNIPADNVESIEIITGLPSVKYGDLTSGIVNIKTKIGKQPLRLKLKNNPDTKEANLGGGYALGDKNLSFNLNVARSERDIRLTGDEYTRVTGQTVLNNTAFDGALLMNHKINAQVNFDDEKPQGDALKTDNYNHDFSIGVSDWGTFTPADGVSSYDYNMYVNMKRANSKKSHLVQSDLRILPNGDTVSVYNGVVETHGIEWTLGGRLEYNRVFFTGDLVHKILAGADIQYNANTGDGVLLDTLFNYYGASSGKRSYRFDDIAGQTLASLYLEDKITGHFLCDFSITAGLRYEMNRPYSFNIKGLWGKGNIVESHQGTFFNPRLNMMFYLSRDNQIRFSAGTTSKTPPMSDVNSPDDVLKWRNPITSSTVYLSFRKSSPELKGYKESQFELAYDHKFFGTIGTSLSAYYKKRNGEPESVSHPVYVVMPVNGINKAYYVGSNSYYENTTRQTESKGIEFSIKTAKIKPLNMEFQLIGSYGFLKYTGGAFKYDDTPDKSLGQYANVVIPGTDSLGGYYYPHMEKWNDYLQLNYYLKYTHPTLGLWVTLRAEQLVWEKKQHNKDVEPIDVNIASASDVATYNFNLGTYQKPIKWLLSLNISKSLFKGAEVSFYVNNFLDDSAIYTYNSSLTDLSQEVRNPPLFYGLEFSFIVDDLFRRGE
jgi:outer membrane receptor for Fe3+-dicitrate